MARILLALALLGSYGSARAQFDFELFNLYTDCDSMVLIVSFDPTEGNELQGLTHSVIGNAVESRLRSARLYRDQPGYPSLIVSVSIVGGAFHGSLRLWKELYDPISGVSHAAPTWSNSSTGTHGSEASYVLSFLSQQIDEFLVEYLRVNEEACASQ